MHFNSHQIAARLFVKSYYTEGHRFYHTMNHIDAMLDGYTKYFGDINEAEYLAILYHDIVYLPFSNRNEENSVGLLRIHHSVYFNKIHSEVLQAASAIILATAHTGWRIPEIAYQVVDLDLMILGSPEEVYLKYINNIRKEYSVYTDEEWNIGRIRILQGFLNTTRIYLTDVMYNLFESTARDNIQKELNILLGLR